MQQDAWRAYLEMALGATEASGKRAVKAVRKLVGKGELTAKQLEGLADELVRASAANREMVAGVVRSELDRALSALGLAKADEVATLTARVRDLETELSTARKAPTALPAALEQAPPSPADDAAQAAIEATAVAAEAARQERIDAAAEPAAAPADAAPAKVAKKAVAKKTVAKKAAVGPKVGEPLPAAAGPPAKKAAKAVKKAKAGTRSGSAAGEPAP